MDINTMLKTLSELLSLCLSLKQAAYALWEAPDEIIKPNSHLEKRIIIEGW